MSSSIVGPKGEVTLPEEIREVLALQEGDTVVFGLNVDGHVILAREKTGSVLDLAGILQREGPPLSQASIDDAIGGAVIEKIERSRRRR